ncbi:hypothetical protein [Subtercola endophyticus]|uniref:hypothetical protein n=1 Tax=Subtercola endophyticus TaxID=2895559 RepID=UPI001E360E09|nr:hypothetical protein [Subtercola endophyticus]UFS57584.1 hypothetical protein LQ955_10975 [Subtercola endophyticus]
MFFSDRSGDRAAGGELNTVQDERRAALKLGRPVAHLIQSDTVKFRGYYWRGSAAPGLPMGQHMVDVVYDVHAGRDVVEISLRSWFGSRGTRTLDDSWEFSSLVATHAFDVLHSISSLARPAAHQLVGESLASGGSHPDLTKIVSGDVRCEFRLQRGAVITIASRPAERLFDDLQVVMFVTIP